MKRSLAHRVIAKKKHKSGKLRSVRIEPSVNGGHTVTHEMDSGNDYGLSMGQSKPHVFADTPSMMKHVGGLFGHKGN